MYSQYTYIHVRNALYTYVCIYIYAHIYTNTQENKSSRIFHPNIHQPLTICIYHKYLYILGLKIHVYTNIYTHVHKICMFVYAYQGINGSPIFTTYSPPPQYSSTPVNTARCLAVRTRGTHQSFESGFGGAVQTVAVQVLVVEHC